MGMRQTIRRLAVSLALAAAVALILAAWWWIDLTRGEPTPFRKPVVVEGRNLKVTYTGGTCQDGSRLVVDEHTDRVVVTVYAWMYPTDCNAGGVPYTLTATLKEDLGDRDLVDGACQMAKFRRYYDCQAH